MNQTHHFHPMKRQCYEWQQFKVRLFFVPVLALTALVGMFRIYGVFGKSQSFHTAVVSVVRLSSGSVLAIKVPRDQTCKITQTYQGYRSWVSNRIHEEPK